MRFLCSRFFSPTALLILFLLPLQSFATTKNKPKAKPVVRTPIVTDNSQVSAARKAERMYFIEAQQALNTKHFDLYQNHIAKLKNYPLLPYLQAQELGERLMMLPRQEVAQFFIRNPNTYVAERLRHRWLRTLALKELWAEYILNYDTNLTDPELACLNLRARLETGDSAALNEVEALWNIDKQQSKSCNPVFDAWEKAGYLTPALVWSRHLKAVKAGEINLAVNLAQTMKQPMQQYAILLENVAQNPRLILQPDNFNLQLPEVRLSVMLGLERYARIDATEAERLWEIYGRKNFSEAEKSTIAASIALPLIRQDKIVLAEQLILATPSLNQPELIEAIIRESLAQQNWGKTWQWLLRLPLEVRNTERWSYWQARLMENLKMPEFEGKSPQMIYTNLAKTRGFYGFLSADKLSIPYNINDKPLLITQDIQRKVEADPSIQRAREFYELGNSAASAQEWTYATHHFPRTEEMVAAGRLADRWGWHRQAIQTFQDSNYLDEITPRFPTPFKENVVAAGGRANIDSAFIYSIAKQESAFNVEVKSPVGATGLMQLMPATAKETAKKAGITFKPLDLINADKNINLGSLYLSSLMRAFGNNRILTSAAYNAGPGKVKQWMHSDNQKVPFDIWVEAIPYKETRLYVQNILSFSVIYAYRTGTKQVFITPEESAQLL